MNPRAVLVVGSGRRARETALPALHRLPDQFEVRGVYARTAKELVVEGCSHPVATLDQLNADALRGVDMVYLAVAKDAVPDVLAHLSALEVGGIDLLIDTPVLRFKHFRHVERIAAFREAWVAEDCAYLPWIDLVRGALDAGRIGEVQGALFTRSAYAYHGLATAKALLGEERVKSARRRKLGDGLAQRDVRFMGGREAWIIEPRDYSVGRIALLGSEGTIADYEHEAEGHLALVPVVEDGEVAGLRLGDETVSFDAQEVSLLRGDETEAGLTARMDAMKRVGFLRLLRAIARGEGAHALDDAIDDMVVDYHLEKFGRYRSTPLTDSRSPLARALLKLVSRAGG